MADAVYLLRLLFDARHVAFLAKERGLPRTVGDVGYAIHTAMGELFDAAKPPVFSVENRARSGEISVLAYSTYPLNDLLRNANLYSDPLVYRTLRTEECVAKPMPVEFKRNELLGFRLRACPVRRRQEQGPNGERKGSETDAYLLALQLKGDENQAVTRESVYSQWLDEQLRRRGGLALETCQLTAFRLARLVRRRGDRKPVEVPRGPGQTPGASGKPDAVLEGTVRLQDRESFLKLLTRGIGRHRAFGFGMLLLRPPEYGEHVASG